MQFSDIFLKTPWQIQKTCYNILVTVHRTEKKSDNIFAGIAQLVEQRIRNAQVACSSHVSSSIFLPKFHQWTRADKQRG